MGNRVIPKSAINKIEFMAMLKSYDLSIRALSKLVDRNDRTIRRYLDDGAMPVDLLDSIYKVLGIEVCTTVDGTVFLVQFLESPESYSVVAITSSMDKGKEAAIHHWTKYHKEAFKRTNEAYGGKLNNCLFIEINPEYWSEPDSSIRINAQYAISPVVVDNPYFFGKEE